ncbi:cytochrome C assembly family protein [Desmospora profundinema]|uniref:HemX protein n=1 Tax=Desmospora profundinema TaxID=1571184 RepID=A0ABU1IP03_9BACL|nr:cytochrome c biogenesis protein CcsA [Desmospora profundinema]MDR6226446.1 HemX protein [Desmospora profundinema]
MFAQHWYYDLIIYIYALSLLFAFSDLLQSNRRNRRLALVFLVAVWSFQTVFLAWKAVAQFPVLTGLDSLLFYSWALVTATLIINWFARIHLFVFAANLVGFAILAAHFFTSPAESPVAKVLLSELVFIHVTLAFLAYALFSLSTVFSGLYLVGNRLLKRKRWNQTLRRLPSLGKLQLFSHRLNMGGVPLLILALILGLVWAHETLGPASLLDPKVIGSLLVLGAYSTSLYQKVRKRWGGQRLAWWNVLSFFTIVINYLISSAGLSFHQWL